MNVNRYRFIVIKIIVFMVLFYYYLMLIIYELFVFMRKVKERLFFF